MKILNLNKKTPFEVLGIDENSPDKYKQLFDYMDGYNKLFTSSVNPFMDLTDNEYVEDRLLDKAGSLVDQIVKIYKEHKKIWKDNCEFNDFKLSMERIGATKITVEDFVKVSAIAFEEYIKNSPFSCNDYAVLASYIGYIDLKDNDKFMGMYDDLYTIKEKYKEIKDVVGDASDFFDKEMKRLQMEKGEENEEMERED